MLYPALLQLLTLTRTPRLPVVDRTDAPADLNGLRCFAERRNLVSALVPSHFKRSLNTLRERETYTSTKQKFHWLKAVANTRTFSSNIYFYFKRDFTASLKQILILCSTFSNVIFV